MRIFSNQIGSLARAYFDSVAHSKFLMGATLNDFLSKLAKYHKEIQRYISIFHYFQYCSKLLTFKTVQ